MTFIKSFANDADMQCIVVWLSLLETGGGFLFLQYPVYFAYENDNMQNILQEVSAKDAAGRPASATTGGYVQPNLNLEAVWKLFITSDLDFSPSRL